MIELPSALLRAHHRSGELVPIERAWALWGHTPGADHPAYQAAAFYTLTRARYLDVLPGALWSYVVLLTPGVTAEVRVCNLTLWRAQRRTPAPQEVP